MDWQHDSFVFSPCDYLNLVKEYYDNEKGCLYCNEECKTISETAAFFNMTEKFIEEIERGALKALRDGMNDGKII